MDKRAGTKTARHSFPPTVDADAGSEESPGERGAGSRGAGNAQPQIVAERLGKPVAGDRPARGRPWGVGGGNRLESTRNLALYRLFYLCREYVATPKISPSEHVSVDFTRI